MKSLSLIGVLLVWSKSWNESKANIHPRTWSTLSQNSNNFKKVQHKHQTQRK